MAGFVSAVVLAAGQSRRMGRPKMNLPWGETTVIGRVVDVLLQGGAGEVLVVTGGAQAEVEAALQETIRVGAPVRLVYNPRYAEDNMTLSLQVALPACAPQAVGALVALGDQPQLEVSVVRAVLSASQAPGAPLVAPSYQMRRGHPWLVTRSLWDEILQLAPGATLRSLFQAHAAEIHYVAVETDTILQDLDTPADYERARLANRENAGDA